MSVSPVSMQVYYTLPGDHRSQKCALNLLELELPIIVSFQKVLGTESCSFASSK